MVNAILSSLGGLGLFLFGMTTMTGGLKGLAGSALRRGLARFTRSPTTGAISGAVGTALIQSSSATTVAAIGFVGAGLMSFPQALGILFGANIGTTITGWLVGLLGFKLGLLTVLWPFVFAGALMVMFGRGKVEAGGRALVGFGLVFVGLAYLQAGLAGFDVTPEHFPDDTWGGRALLVLLGLVVTLLTQSSSAGVAAAMAAVLAGSISLPQAAAMVIGMDVGTTITAAFAAVGSNVAGKRTAAAHVFYNVCTGVAAFVCLPAYFAAWGAAGEPGADDPQLVLVGFHTAFNTLGVLVVLPLTGTFARFIERIVPDTDESVVSALPAAVRAQPEAALDVVGRLLADALATAHRAVADAASGRTQAPTTALATDLVTLREIVLGLQPDPIRRGRRLAALHVIDHLERLIERVERGGPVSNPEVVEHARPLAELCTAQAERYAQRPPTPDIDGAQAAFDGYVDRHRGRRQTLLEEALEVTADAADAADALDRRLDGERWVLRCAHHCARAGAWWSTLARGTDAPGPTTEP